MWFLYQKSSGSPHCERSHCTLSLLWRHNGRHSVYNHQPHGCLLNRLFRHRSRKTSKLRVTGLCAGNSPGAGEFPAQMASNAENVSIWWRHHVFAARNGWNRSVPKYTSVKQAVSLSNREQRPYSFHPQKAQLIAFIHSHQVHCVHSSKSILQDTSFMKYIKWRLIGQQEVWPRTTGYHMILEWCRIQSPTRTND